MPDGRRMLSERSAKGVTVVNLYDRSDRHMAQLSYCPSDYSREVVQLLHIEGTTACPWRSVEELLHTPTHRSPLVPARVRSSLFAPPRSLAFAPPHSALRSPPPSACPLSAPSPQSTGGAKTKGSGPRSSSDSTRTRGGNTIRSSRCGTRRRRRGGTTSAWGSRRVGNKHKVSSGFVLRRRARGRRA